MKKKILFIISLTMLLNVGCSDYLDVNTNIDAPAEVEGSLYLAGITQQYQGLYWDIRALGPLTQMMGTTAYKNYATHSFIPGSDAAGESFRLVYWGQGMNLENMINQSLENEDWTLAGIGYAIKAFSWDMLTKLHADVPMKQAFVAGLLSHDYDYQEEVYKEVRNMAYKSIELLEKEDATIYGNKIVANDFIYKGNKEKWLKFANAVIVRNLASLSNKTDFKEKYFDELVRCAEKSFQSSDDDATVKILAGSQEAPFSAYNNFWGTARRNLNRAYFQHEYAVQVFTGTVPTYNEGTGEKNRLGDNDYYPYELAARQIICDTLVDQLGHYDPRVAVKLATASNPQYNNLNDADSVKLYRYYGGGSTGFAGPIGSAPSFYGRREISSFAGNVHDGIGRWLYRDDAPYILMTCAEIKFCLAEAYFKTGDKAKAFEAFKEGVRADLAFTSKYIVPGKEGSPTGGDKIKKELFIKLGEEYFNGAYVSGLSVSDFSLSHIMMQKWVALYPWGAHEAWVDMRKYHYDIDYTGEYPKDGNGWDATSLAQKWDTNPEKVYKGLYLLPAQVQGRKGKYDIKNEGSPCYRLRPRYNSEYMWNEKSLDALKPIPGTADNYHCSKPWFAYPGELPLSNN